MNDELTTRLSRQLHDQVDGWHDAPLTLEGVQGRARTIRRRRQAMTSGVVAAAVLAIAVPVGVSLSTRTDSTPDVTNPSPTRMVDEGPTPRADGTFPLAPLEAPQGIAPELGYISLADSVLNAGGRQLPAGTQQLEQFGDGWLALSPATGLHRLDAGFKELDRVDARSLVVDAAGEHAAWIEVDRDRYTLVQADPGGELARTPVGQYARVVGHLTGDRVVVDDPDLDTGEQRAFVASVDGSTTDFDGYLRPISASEATSQVSVLTEYGVDTCYAVLDPATGTRAFETCDFEPQTFSPDGSLVVGTTAGDDGLGSPQLAVLDAATGEPVVEWSSERRDRSPALVQQVVWEDDDTLLATVTDGTEQTVVRAELDGSMEQVAEPAAVEMSIAYTLPGFVLGLG